MATGRGNKLTGQVGEFLVCAELGRRGYIATPFSGNVPGFDVIATDARCRSVPVQVKTISTGDWPTAATKHLQIEFDAATGVQHIRGRQPLADPETVMVFMRLRKDDSERDRFFIITRREFQQLVEGHYKRFLGLHGGRRPQKPSSDAVRIRLHEIEPHENRWELIENQLERVSDS